MNTRYVTLNDARVNKYPTFQYRPEPTAEWLDFANRFNVPVVDNIQVDFKIKIIGDIRLCLVWVMPHAGTIAKEPRLVFDGFASRDLSVTKTTQWLMDCIFVDSAVNKE